MGLAARNLDGGRLVYSRGPLSTDLVPDGDHRLIDQLSVAGEHDWGDSGSAAFVMTSGHGHTALSRTTSPMSMRRMVLIAGISESAATASIAIAEPTMLHHLIAKSIVKASTENWDVKKMPIT